MYGKDIEAGFIDIGLQEIGERYGRLRIINPKADALMFRSMERYGQVSPVVVHRLEGDRYELVDGFKRLRAARKLKGYETLKARVMDVGIRAGKALILHLNWRERSISDMEEAIVVHSLYREDSLTQAEIATLLSRHKSWVCRRISLIERLCDEVQDNLRLGLIRLSVGRELARLPRGNQQKALSTILKYRFTHRETARLVSILLERPRWEHETVLRFPAEILKDRTPDRPRNSGLSRKAALFHGKLIAIERSLISVSKEFNKDRLSQFSDRDRGRLLIVVDGIKKGLSHLKDILYRE